MKITMKNEKIIKVLVADNSEFAKNNLRDFLESSEGIQLINVVDNGKDAYHFIMDEAPDIVLIDVILPVMDGFTVIEKVNAKTVFILPNNKNIILAANQAASLVEDKKIIVIPTKTIPQGITALINYIPDSTPEDNEQRMSSEISMVKTGQVTYAVRDTVIDDKEIKQDDFMGIGDSGILSVGQNLEPTVMDMMKQLVDEDSAIVSIYYGEDTKEEDANALGEKIGEAFPDVEIEVHYGGQPIYYYVISVE